MLVLSRKSGQEIQIGDEITITVTRVGRNQVRLGIVAPMEVPIRRGELRLRPEPVRNRVPAALTDFLPSCVSRTTQAN